ncbi:MAG: LysM peptidoglycan-binding domain-containing protein [Candidatus Auribacter fodinae]|uniref:LysM peptidoglycan-binding domain-containing protein n=1 Tax=Candidatus Auribacter fodinae TaxID=2093366 RepID=A0A3A4QY34_9BACT|nr:MAG: LysM peptidoglycan-binding domain-containing protein [Candidatus Auribacter fodinae]
MISPFRTSRLNTSVRRVLLVILVSALPSYAGPIQQPVSHKVQAGDTLWKISQRYNVSVKAILDANELSNADKIRINQVLVIPGKPVQEPQEQEQKQPEYSKDKGVFHTLKKGETIWNLSKIYQVPISTIIQANNIDFPERMKPGQTVFIPMTEERLSQHDELAGMKSYVESLVKLSPRQKMRDWKYIIIHHSATDMGNAASFEYYHRFKRHMTNGLAYHFVITNGKKGSDGGVEVGNRWKKQLQGGHVKSDFYNEVGIGICLVGNFQNYPPSISQYNSLVSLVQVLKDLCNIPTRNVFGHGELRTEQSLCPGKCLPLKKLRSQLTGP